MSAYTPFVGDRWIRHLYFRYAFLFFIMVIKAEKHHIFVNTNYMHESEMGINFGRKCLIAMTNLLSLPDKTFSRFYALSPLGPTAVV